MVQPFCSWPSQLMTPFSAVLKACQPTREAPEAAPQSGIHTQDRHMHQQEQQYSSKPTPAAVLEASSCCLQGSMILILPGTCMGEITCSPCICHLGRLGKFTALPPMQGSSM